MCHSTSLTSASFYSARGVVKDGGSWAWLLKRSLPPGRVEAKPLQPPQLQGELIATFFLLQVERCLIEGLYNALKRQSTALGPKLLLLSCPGTAPSRRKTSLLNWRKKGKEMQSYFCYLSGNKCEPPGAEVFIQKRQGLVKSQLQSFRTSVHALVVLSFVFALSVIACRLIKWSINHPLAIPAKPPGLN